jgi:hypothetical protein
MNKLTIKSFNRIDSPQVLSHYFSHKTEDGREVCLESCMSGYCVAVYDATQNIIGKKTCTDLRSDFGYGLEKAVQIANEKLGHDTR